MDSNRATANCSITTAPITKDTSTMTKSMAREHCTTKKIPQPMKAIGSMNSFMDMENSIMRSPNNCKRTFLSTTGTFYKITGPSMKANSKMT